MLAADYGHAVQGPAKTCRAVLAIGIGGAGRVAARVFYRSAAAFHGAECPHIGLAEYDLCDQTGRDPATDPLVPSTPGRLVVHLVERVDCSALVATHGADRSFPMWDCVNPEVIAQITDTAHLGGYAGPQVARAAFEFNPRAIDDFVRKAGQLADRLQAPQPGWSCRGSLLAIVFASCAGAVGSSSLHVIERIRPNLRQPFRIIHNTLLIADKGSVPNRLDSQALQHAFLTEIRHRARRTPWS